MTRGEAIDLFHAIQNGRGTGDLREAYRRQFGMGQISERLHHGENAEFTLGVEYGILIALSLALGLTKEDV